MLNDLYREEAYEETLSQIRGQVFINSNNFVTKDPRCVILGIEMVTNLTSVETSEFLTLNRKSLTLAFKGKFGAA